jgi:hypothetical protein
MYAQTVDRAPSSYSPAARPTRATLKTRPLIQRALIRSWEYIGPVRATLLAIRMLAVFWMIISGALLMSAGINWGWILLPGALVAFALSGWVFSTAAKGWPIVKS